MNTCYLDIETTTDHSTIWCAVTKVKNDIQVHTTPDSLRSVLNEADRIIGHNLIGFDCRVLDSVWDIHVVTDWPAARPPARNQGVKVHLGRVFDICV